MLLDPRFRPAALITLLTAASACATDRSSEDTNQDVPTTAPEQPLDVTVDVRTRLDWHEVRALPHNLSAVAIHRALRADDTPYDTSYSVVGTSPENIRRGFVIERNEWLLGEPLLVEFRVEVDGPDPWKEVIGGNYRGRGRDDNFLFVLERADGSLVPDVYTGQPMIGGGISAVHDVTSKQPLSYWLAVQRYSAIIEPGSYNLYCLGFEHGTEVAGWHEALAELTTGQPAGVRLSPTWVQQPSRSSLADRVPKSLASLAIDQVTDFAQFHVEIREPTASERRAMIESWTRAVELYDQSWPTPRGDAAREAMWFARQDDFLPLLESWLRSGQGYRPQDLDGLALRGTAQARELLLAHGGEAGQGALRLFPDPDQ